jgi:hypothetical protein
MVKMQFENSLLEKIIRRWKWGRNNTILLFAQAAKEGILNFASKSEKQKKYTFQPLLFQFQCIVTTTDTYYRKLIGATNTSYGILIINGKVYQKEAISIEIIKEQLENQMHMLDTILRPFTAQDLEKHIRPILTISDHEYMHQGEMLLMFRQAGVELPERFSKAWALG